LPYLVAKNHHRHLSIGAAQRMLRKRFSREPWRVWTGYPVHARQGSRL